MTVRKNMYLGEGPSFLFFITKIIRFLFSPQYSKKSEKQTTHILIPLTLDKCFFLLGNFKYVWHFP